MYVPPSPYVDTRDSAPLVNAPFTCSQEDAVHHNDELKGLSTHSDDEDEDDRALLRAPQKA
jgi:hypothetical protein